MQKPTHTLSNTDSSFRGEHECEGLYRTSAGVVVGPKKRDAIADHSFFKGRQ